MAAAEGDQEEKKKTAALLESRLANVLAGNSKAKEEKARQIVLERKESDWKEKTDAISGLMAKRRPITAESVANGTVLNHSHAADSSYSKKGT